MSQAALAIPPDDQVTALARTLDYPVMVVSSRVGRGSFSIGEAVAERLADHGPVHHLACEDLLAAAQLQEDHSRYKWICTHAPFLLELIYSVPFIFQRKLLRERYGAAADLGLFAAAIERLAVRSAIGISHRPTFWLASLKRRARLSLKLWGLATDFRRNIAWRYQFWDMIDGYLGPLGARELGFELPASVELRQALPPVRRCFEGVAGMPGDPRQVLLMSGYWALGKLDRVVAEIRAAAPDVTVHVACGANAEAHASLARAFSGDERVRPYLDPPSMILLYEQCASVVTKPGAASLLEAAACRRKVFLLGGLPVIERGNALFAMQHFGAEPFSPQRFATWRESLARARP